MTGEIEQLGNEMERILILNTVIAIPFLLMAYRAFRSGSATDYLLCATQCVGLLLLLSEYRQLALYLLLLSAIAYLISQIMTGARPISRLLPIVGVLSVLPSLWLFSN